jgi:putrescine transport system substrate-binding protein
MRLRNSLRMLGFLIAALIASAVAADERVVNVYNWTDYIDPDVLTQFSTETGIRVVYDVYDSNDIVETKLLAGNSGYDVVVPSDSNIAREIKAGTLMKLDKSKLPNLVHMWPFVMDRLAAFDPGNQYAVDYMWGTAGLGINLDMVKQRLGDVPLDTWRLFLDPGYAAKLADCGIHVIDTPEDVIQGTLSYLGINPNSDGPVDIEKAGAALEKVRPYIQKFGSSEYINALANGDICMAVGYSGDVLQARDRAREAKNGVNIAYILPKEGALMWLDSLVIPADAPHPDEAHAFIDFMMRPEIAAANSNYILFANGNRDSQPLLAKDVISDEAIYPDAATLGRLFNSATYDPRSQRVLTRMWTTLKAGG